MSIFGKPAGTSSIFGGGNTSSPFGQSTTNTQAMGSSLFGQPQQQQQQLQQLQQQQQQVQQQQQMGGSILNQSVLSQSQAGLNPVTNGGSGLGGSLWQPGSMTPHQKSIPAQISSVVEKWDPSSPHCVFRHYFYNKVDESRIPFYAPGPHEDPREWEAALSAKPAPGYVPALARGFETVAERCKVQRRAVGEYNLRLHEINRSLDAMLSRHDLETSVRTALARRRHVVLRERCLRLAAKVQVLRNRGYALSTDEDELRQKLELLDKSLGDPGMNARAEELWSRLSALRDVADRLRDELVKGTGQEDGVLGEEVESRAKKILEDYEKQLQHLKKETESVKHDFEEWEKEHHGPR